MLCRILRPACVAATIAMMGLLVGYFWGFVDLTGLTMWRVLISYCVLMIGSFIIFYFYDPSTFRRSQ